MRTLVWFRGKDLRVADHGPLSDAAEKGEVIPLFVLDPFFFEPRAAARIPHRMQLLLEGLEALRSALEARGSRLLLLAGPSADVVPQAARDFKVDRVVAQRWVEPLGRARDKKVQARLEVPLELFEGETLHPPNGLRTGSDTPYSVFTPFARAFWREVSVGAPLAAPRLPPLPDDVRVPAGELPSLADFGLRRNPNLLAGGEAAGRQRLERFLRGRATRYANGRKLMGEPGTSRLSVDLKFGTVSPRTVFDAARRALMERHPEAWRAFANELVWREFTHALLDAWPHLLEKPFRAGWEDFPWRDDEAGFGAWAEGQTGYPLVDAAARELRAEGFVHNRARMVAASFLCKHLLIDYRRGEAHYAKWLADGDPPQNNAGWQWSAGCGCDAQPWFRIFNPVAQGEQFDPGGAYVRRWLPQLERLPDRFVHRPFEAPPDVLAQAGVALGKNYPRPIVDHAQARARFLAVAKEHLQGHGAASKAGSTRSSDTLPPPAKRSLPHGS